MTLKKIFTINSIMLVLLSGCSTGFPTSVKAPDSYLSNKNVSVTLDGIEVDKQKINQQNTPAKANVENITSLSINEEKKEKKVDLTRQFSKTKLVQLTADDLSLKDYLHYVFGELLGVNYILGQDVKADNKVVSLNIQNKISEQKLFSLSKQVLEDRSYVIRMQDGIYYIHKSKEGNAVGNIIYGYGNKLKDIPNTSGTIVQLVPFHFGMQTSLASNLKKIVKIGITPDFERNAIILKGKRKEIIKALEFITLMDQPKLKDRRISIYQGQYVSTDDLVSRLPLLLKQEGISVDVKGLADKAVAIVPLERIGSIVLFANNQQVIDRVVFWANKLDQPPSGNQLQYFIYPPKFARATDLGESLQTLIGGSSVSASISSSTSAASQNTRTRNTPNTNKSASITASNNDMKLVVDERTNSLIFHTTGDKYQQILPLIKRLDVMPKQVLLEVMIAEVKLTDAYKQGVDFVLTNQGDAKEVGGFNLSGGSAGLTYLLSGSKGSLTFNLLQTNTNVNVLSRPSLLVRDGVQANITVGDDIPTVGEIITDPVNGAKSSVVYRKTGVDLKVKPTINARGVVIMEIDQSISNQATGDDSVAGSPIIFERSISTEVVAESGQTIVLGGLISENRTLTDTSVPFFSSLPILGKLFDSTNDNKDKTELVVLVTPKIIESTDEWDEIKAKFAAGLTQVKL